MTGPWAITGAAGFLGSHVVESLLARGIPVLAIDDFSVGRREYLPQGHAGLTVAEVDIRRPAELSALFQQYRPTVVMHFAALHYIPACSADPTRTLDLNVVGTQSVLQAARLVEVPRLLFTSTGDVYLPSETPHREDDSIAPFTIYGLSKVMGEQLIALESRLRPTARFTVARLFNLYGPRETNPHLLPEVIAQLRQSPDTTLRLGSLWPTRDLVPVADAARALIGLVEAADPGVTTINVASGVSVSMQEVLDLIGELRGKPLSIVTDPAKVRPVERGHLRADVTRLRERLGWSPHADLRRGLADLLASELGSPSR